MVELIIVLLGIVLFYVSFVIPTKWLKVERVEVPLGINKKILQLSDLHVERNRIRPEQIRDLLVSEKPDYIFITGDFTAGEKYISRIKPYLNLFQEYGKVVYAVFGNHDYRTEELPHRLLSWLGENGVRVLINESIELDDFTLVGLDFYKEEDGDVERAFREVKSGKPKVVLSHDPNDFLRVEKPFDLMLSGHLHGKQFNVPFFFKFISKGKLAQKGIYKGLHQIDGTHLYISKGMGQAHWNLRLGVRSEVTVLTLTAGKKGDEKIKT